MFTARQLSTLCLLLSLSACADAYRKKRSSPSEAAVQEKVKKEGEDVAQQKAADDVADHLESRRAASEESFVEKHQSRLDQATQWKAGDNVDCVGYWGAWGFCNKHSCKQSRDWRVSTPPRGNGKGCPAKTKEARMCPPSKCTPKAASLLEGDAESETEEFAEDVTELDQRRSSEEGASSSSHLDSALLRKGGQAVDRDCEGYWGNWNPCDSDCKTKRVWRMQTPQSGNGKECPTQTEEKRSCPASKCAP